MAALFAAPHCSASCRRTCQRPSWPQPSAPTLPSSTAGSRVHLTDASRGAAVEPASPAHPSPPVPATMLPPAPGPLPRQARPPPLAPSSPTGAARAAPDGSAYCAGGGFGAPCPSADTFPQTSAASRAAPAGRMTRSSAASAGSAYTAISCVCTAGTRNTTPVAPSALRPEPHVELDTAGNLCDEIHVCVAGGGSPPFSRVRGPSLGLCAFGGSQRPTVAGPGQQRDFSPTPTGSPSPDRRPCWPWPALNQASSWSHGTARPMAASRHGGGLQNRD